MYHIIGRQITRIGIISMALLTIFVLSIVPFRGQYTAYAAGLLSISVTDGPIGTQVKFTGTGFVSNMIIRLYFSPDDAVTGNVLDTQVNTYELLGEVMIDSLGTLGQSGAFIVPSMMDDGRTDRSVITGDHYIYVTYSGYKSIQAKASFFVTGPVTTTPSSGRIGDYTLISGKSLKTDDMIFIYFSSNKAAIGAMIDSQVTSYQTVGTFVANPDGTLGGGVPFQIPNRLTSGIFQEDVHGGEYYIYFTYGANRKRIETISRFTILDGEVNLEPSHGQVGSEISLSGSGLRPNQQITVKYDNDLLAISGGVSSSDASGHFSVKIVIPESTIGSHQLMAADVTGNHPVAWFDIEPSVRISDPATAGSQVEISGFGFSETQGITLTIADQIISTTPATISTNYNGSFKGTFRAPASTGPVTMIITDKMNIKTEVSINIIATPGIESSLSLFPVNSQANPGSVGKPLTVNGSGFMPNGPVTITYNNTSPSVYPGIQANAEGSIQFTFEIPAGPAGEHQIEATDGTNTSSIIFILENTAPTPPIALLPEIVSGVEPSTRFDWSDVDDSSGVTYTFQVSPDTTFNQIVLDKNGLSVSEYTMKADERLELRGRQTAYYWRVSAVDRAGNESTWSNSILFYVGSAKTAFPVWVIYLLGGLGVIIVLVVAVWLVRIRKNRVK